jgi:AcrR family transcriptional regulator
MARPSVAEERRREIIEATIRTIATRGITGTTLDRIAEEAGMSRGHVRHFVGNRDQLLVETARRFYFGDDDITHILPTGADTIGVALDFLFGGAFTTPGEDNSVVLGLVEAARTNPALGEILASAYAGTQAMLADLLAKHVPLSDPDQRDRVAYGVLVIALGNVFMGDVGVTVQRTDAGRSVADQLIDSLRRP